MKKKEDLCFNQICIYSLLVCHFPFPLLRSLTLVLFTQIRCVGNTEELIEMCVVSFG